MWLFASRYLERTDTSPRWQQASPAPATTEIRAAVRDLGVFPIMVELSRATASDVAISSL